MSGQATGWVLRHGPRPEMADRTGKRYAARARGLRSVLLTIADAANRDGENAHPGLAAMIDGSLYSKRQVLNIEDELVADGWVVITERGGGRGKATVYTIPGVREKVQPLHSGKGATGDEERCTPDSETVQPERETVQRQGSDLQVCSPNGVATEPPTVESNLGAPSGADDRNLPAIVQRSGFLPDALSLCEHLAGQLAARGYANEARQATGVRAIRDMEAILRIDERSPEQIRFVLDWLDAGADKVSEFWRRNVRSPGSLRSQLPRLREEYQAMKTKPARGENFGLDRDAVDRIQAQARNGHTTNGHTSEPSSGRRAIEVASREPQETR